MNVSMVMLEVLSFLEHRHFMILTFVAVCTNFQYDMWPLARCQYSWRKVSIHTICSQYWLKLPRNKEVKSERNTTKRCAGADFRATAAPTIGERNISSQPAVTAHDRLWTESTTTVQFVLQIKPGRDSQIFVRRCRRIHIELRIPSAVGCFPCQTACATPGARETWHFMWSAWKWSIELISISAMEDSCSECWLDCARVAVMRRISTATGNGVCPSFWLWAVRGIHNVYKCSQKMKSCRSMTKSSVICQRQQK